MRYAIIVMLFVAANVAAAQTCICTSGCKIASDPYPPGSAQPTSCAVYKGGVQISNSPVVLSNTIPTNNASVCSPASATYNPGVAGSVSCEVVIGNQPAGSVTLTMTATNGAGETAQSLPFTFISASTFPLLPAVPTNLRPN